MTERKGRLLRAALAAVALGLILAFQEDLVGLVPRHLALGARLLTVVLAAALGSEAIRDGVAGLFGRLDPQAAMLWRNLSTWTLYALLALLLASAERINLSGLLVGGAILGVVVASVSQASLGNLFAGLILMLSRPYRVGDTVRLRGALFGGVEFEGLVTDVGALHTTLLSSRGETMRVPNNAVIGSALVIGEALLLADVELRLPPSRPPAEVAESVRRALGREQALVSIDPTAVGPDGELTYRLCIRSRLRLEGSRLSEALRAGAEVS